LQTAQQLARLGVGDFGKNGHRSGGLQRNEKLAEEGQGVQRLLGGSAVALPNTAVAAGASELQHVPDTRGGGGLGAAVAACAAACAIGRLHFIAGHVAGLGLHRNRLCLPAHTQLINAAARVFHLDALGALVGAACRLLLI
jgi:hypothetical protein